MNKLILQTHENLLREGNANLQRGWETVGGRLYLTNQRLYFIAHSFNVQSGVTEISLNKITHTKPCWTMFLALIPIFPNSLSVKTIDGNEFRFVLFGRLEWAAAINKLCSPVTA